jgi:hypothetical protein
LLESAQFTLLIIPVSCLYTVNGGMLFIFLIRCFFLLKVDCAATDTCVLGGGIPRAPGTVSGVAVFTVDDAVECSMKGKSCILFKTDMTPGDAAGMQVNKNIQSGRLRGLSVMFLCCTE